MLFVSKNIYVPDKCLFEIIDQPPALHSVFVVPEQHSSGWRRASFGSAAPSGVLKFSHLCINLDFNIYFTLLQRNLLVTMLSKSIKQEDDTKFQVPNLGFHLVKNSSVRINIVEFADII